MLNEHDQTNAGESGDNREVYMGKECTKYTKQEHNTKHQNMACDESHSLNKEHSLTLEGEMLALDRRGWGMFGWWRGNDRIK